MGILDDLKPDLLDYIRTRVNEELGVVTSVKICHDVAESNATAIKALMPCYDPSRCGVGVRCGECGR